MPMRSAAAARLRTVRSVSARSSTVRSVASLAAATSAPERAISARRSRAAAPTASTLRAASAAASAAEVVRSRISLLRGAEVGGGHPDLLAGLVECRDHLVDGGAELLGDEGVPGKVELGFRHPAAVRDRERIGVDQRLAHPLGGGRDLAHGAAADPFRQGRIAVAGSDLGDRLDERAQAALGPPRGRQPGRQRRGSRERQARGGPADQRRCPGREQNREQYPPRWCLASNMGGHFKMLSRIAEALTKLRVFDYQILSRCCATPG